MEAANLTPTPPPDKILAIALGVVAIFGAAEIAGVAVHYINRARAEYVATHPQAPAAPVEAPKETVAPVEETTPAKTTTAPVTTTNTTTTTAPPPAAAQTSPSSAVLSVAER